MEILQACIQGQHNRVSHECFTETTFGKHATTLHTRVKPRLSFHLSHTGHNCLITAFRTSVLSRSIFGRKPDFVGLCSLGFGDFLLCRNFHVLSVCKDTVKVRTLAGPRTFPPLFTSSWTNWSNFSNWSGAARRSVAWSGTGIKG